MIYLLANRDNEVSWLPGYANNLVKGFSELGVEFEFIPTLQREFERTDTIIIVDYWDLGKAVELKKELGENSPIMVSHSHGSSAFLLGFKRLGELQKEKTELRSMDIVACNTLYHTRTMEEEFGVNAVHTGYPIDIENIRRVTVKLKKEKGKIVVGGRLEQDRQLYLAVEALLPYGKQVVFCCPHSRAVAEDVWGAEGIRRYEDIFRFEWNYCQRNFYNELSTAEIVTTFGCVDTLNLSIIEGYILGAYPLVPNKLPYLEYVSGGYKPYCIEDIRRRIKKKPRLKVNVEQYHYRIVARKYLDAIEKEKTRRR